MLRIFRHRNYALLATGNVVNQLGMWGRMIGIGWAAQGLTESAFLVGVAHGSQFLPTLLLAPFSGLVADRFDRRHVAVVGNIGMAIPSALITVLLLADRLTITGLVLLALLGGTLQSFTSPAISALVPHTVPAEDVAAAIAVNSVLSNISRFLGAALVGLIIAAWDTPAAFAFNSISMVIVAVPWLAMRVTVPPRMRSDESFFSQLAGGYRFARRTPSVGNLLVLSTVAAFLIMHQSLMPLIARDLLHAGPSVYGLLQASIGIGAIMGALVAGRAAVGPRLVIVLSVGLLCTAASVLGVSVSSWVLLSVAVQILFGFGYFILTTCVVTVIMLSTPDTHLGRVMALQSMATAGMVPICALAAGFFASLVGTRTTLAAAGSLLGAYALWFIARKVRLIAIVPPSELSVPARTEDAQVLVVPAST